MNRKLQMLALIVTLWMQVSLSTPQEQLLQVSTGYMVSRCLHVAAELCIADALQAPKSCDDLAEALHLDSQMLESVMRILVSHELFDQDAEGLYCLNDQSYYLQSDVPGSMRSLLCLDEYRWNSIGNLKLGLQTGQSVTQDVCGDGYFGLLKKDANAARLFHQEMKGWTSWEEQALVSALEFQPGARILDGGGGNGRFIGQLLKDPAIHFGMVLDLEAAFDSLDSDFLEQVGPRAGLKVGSFFEAIPSGYDYYLLKRILHDWSDAESVAILSRCAEAMSSSSTLYIIEGLIQEDQGRNLLKEYDLFLRLIFGGKERTMKEFENIVLQAGLRINRTIPTGTLVQVLEVVKI